MRAARGGGSDSTASAPFSCPFLNFCRGNTAVEELARRTPAATAAPKVLALFGGHHVRVLARSTTVTLAAFEIRAAFPTVWRLFRGAIASRRRRCQYCWLCENRGKVLCARVTTLVGCGIQSCRGAIRQPRELRNGRLLPQSGSVLRRHRRHKLLRCGHLSPLRRLRKRVEVVIPASGGVIIRPLPLRRRLRHGLPKRCLRTQSAGIWNADA
mmetsp:Transcript_46045/g.127926  ORF Transcript_46045/g.127926 Transcript_46045/m.127926 type:complete len:212 (-) Transcript_46045:255-890(-)